MNKNFLFLTLALVVGLFSATSVQASILWAGTEDIDFPNGASPCVNTNTQFFRSAFVRESLFNCGSGSASISPTFPGGAVTSAWLSAQVYNSLTTTGMLFVGLSKSGATGSLYVGTDTTLWNKTALYAYNGSSWTQLATEVGQSLNNTGQLLKFDMQVISYGASATVNVYLNSAPTPLITFTGNVLVGTATSLDSAGFYGQTGGVWFSEMIVSTTDTRNFSLATLAPASAGDTNNWTGAYSAINGTSVNQSSVVNDSTSGDNFQCRLNSLPSGSFSIAAIVLAAQATEYSTGVKSIKLGVKTNATINVPAAVTQTGAWATMNTIYNTNPVTTVNWTSSDANALQIDLQTAP